MRERLSHDFIDNRHRLKPFSAKIAIFVYKKRFLQNLHRRIWTFCTHIDLRIVHLHFLCGMHLQLSTTAVRMHVFM